MGLENQSKNPYCLDYSAGALCGLIAACKDSPEDSGEKGLLEPVLHIGDDSFVSKEVRSMSHIATQTRKPCLAFVVSGFESFVTNELLEFDRLGYPMLILVNNWASKVRASVVEWKLDRLDMHAYIAVGEAGFLSYLWDIVTSNVVECIRNPIRYFVAYKEAARFLGLKKFLRSMLFVRKIRKRRAKHIHAQFAYENAEIARVLALYLNKPYSFTGHANDIFVQKQNLTAKIESASFVRTISEFNKSYLEKNFPCNASNKVKVIHCGVKVPPDAVSQMGSGDEYIVVSIGRFVEKKGFEYLLAALRILQKSGKKIYCKVVGDGPLREDLQRMRSDLKSVEFLGQLSNAEVIRCLKNCHCFVLPCVMASDGDIDGIPVVLMEAMSLGLPVISTSVSGIPELVEDGVNGILVPEKDPVAIANAIRWIAEHPEQARSMGMSGRQKVLEVFSLQKIVYELAQELERHCG